MTTWEVPLPPDDLAMVWDKDADPWARVTQGNGASGGMWREAKPGLGVPGTRTWYDLVCQFGPLLDYEPRCEAFSKVVGDDRKSFRCLLAPNHSGHHKLPETCWSTP